MISIYKYLKHRGIYKSCSIPVIFCIRSRLDNNTNAVNNMLIQPPFTNDNTRKQKYLGYLSKKKVVGFFFPLKITCRENFLKMWANQWAAAQRWEEPRRGSSTFHLWQSHRGSAPPVPTEQRRASACNEEQRYTAFIRWEGICQRLIEFHCNIHISQRHTLTGSNYFQQAGPATRTLWTGMALQSVCFRSDR